MTKSFENFQEPALSDEALLEVNRLWTIVRAFSNVAHDVNNALQVISGSAELLVARGGDPLLQRRLEAIGTHAAAAAATIERLVSYARDGSGAPQAIDLMSVVDAALALRACSLGRARIAIATERSTADPFWVRTDQRRTLQMLLCVLLFIEERLRGTQNGRIVVRVRRENNRVAMAVTSSAEKKVGDVSPPDIQRPPSVAAITSASQLPVARQIAAAEGAALEVTGEGHDLTVTMTFKAIDRVSASG